MVRKAIICLTIALALVCGGAAAQQDDGYDAPDTTSVTILEDTISGTIIRIYNQEEFRPTAFHQTIHSMMSFCTRLWGNYTQIRWYMAELIVVGDPNSGHTWAGMWTQVNGYPEITLKRENVFNGGTVSHELIHFLFKGQAPMDVASNCILDWKKVTLIQRIPE